VPRVDVAPRLDDDVVEAVTRGGQPAHFGVDSGTFTDQALHHCRCGRSRVDAGQQLYHAVAAESGSEQFPDEHDALDRILIIDSLPAGCPTRPNQPPLLVVAK
jgi:hypothetical protein